VTRRELASLLAAAVAAFVVGSIWYGPLPFGDVCMRLRGVEGLRCLVVA
jgi:hypothetical protein